MFSSMLRSLAAHVKNNVGKQKKSDMIHQQSNSIKFLFIQISCVLCLPLAHFKPCKLQPTVSLRIVYIVSL